MKFKLFKESSYKEPRSLFFYLACFIIVGVVCAFISSALLESLGFEFGDSTSDGSSEIVLLYAWRDAGCPQDDNLAGFMSKFGRGGRFVVSNLVVTIDGTNYTTLFATKQRSNGRKRTILVTTNGIVVLKPTFGKIQVLIRDQKNGVP